MIEHKEFWACLKRPILIKFLGDLTWILVPLVLFHCVKETNLFLRMSDDTYGMRRNAELSLCISRGEPDVCTGLYQALH